MKELDHALEKLQKDSERKKDLMKVRLDVFSEMGMFVSVAKFFKKIIK